jgi:hypothetical protein
MVYIIDPFPISRYLFSLNTLSEAYIVIPVTREGI